MANVDILDSPDSIAIDPDTTIFVNDDGVLSQAKASVLVAGLAAASRWSPVAASRFTSLPTNSSTIAVSNTAGIVAGVPIKVFQSSGWRYNVVTAVVANTSVTVAGAGLLTGQTIGEMSTGTPEMVSVMELFVPGAYASQLTATAIRTLNRMQVRWSLAEAYLVSVSMVQDVAEASSQPKVNVTAGGFSVLSTDGSLGMTLGAAGVRVRNSGNDINTSRYKVQFDDEIELSVNRAGTVATDLGATLIFVME